jgi:predicted O-methyltransferase YrrM
VLPTLPTDPPLDLVFIDGCHGFPTPMVEWYYACSRLRADGVLVIDDVRLPAVAQLCAFLDRDPRFRRKRELTPQFAAYRRVDEGTLAQDWWQQPDFNRRRGLSVPRRAVRKLRRSILSAQV